jgi:hypothetical protein
MSNIIVQAVAGSFFELFLLTPSIDRQKHYYYDNDNDYSLFGHSHPFRNHKNTIDRVYYYDIFLSTKLNLTLLKDCVKKT